MTLVNIAVLVWQLWVTITIFFLMRDSSKIWGTINTLSEFDLEILEALRTGDRDEK